METVKQAAAAVSDGRLGHVLPTRQLGKNGPFVTAMGYGTMGLSAFYGTPKPDEERFAVLDKVYNEGDLFWDTADMYKDSEDLLGNWFKRNPGKREQIFLASKFAIRNDEKGNRTIDSSYEYCLQACDRSLKRLGVNHIDLYYIHRLDGKTPIEKTVQALAKLKREGKIKYIGLSEVSAASLRRAHAVEPIDAVQIEYSPFTLDIENPQVGLLAACKELGVAVVAYAPLGRGMLGGNIRSPDDFVEGDFRKNAPRFSKENFPKNLELVDQIHELAKKKNVTASQLTLAWLLAQSDNIFPIPGTTNLARVEENIGALKVKLTTDEISQIRAACEKAEPAGTRYPEASMKMAFADSPPLES